jgi:hypothetical protein
MYIKMPAVITVLFLVHKWNGAGFKISTFTFFIAIACTAASSCTTEIWGVGEHIRFMTLEVFFQKVRLLFCFVVITFDTCHST